MDVILIIATAAAVIITIILIVGFYNISIDNSVECANLDSDLYRQLLYYNESAKQYRYRANDLDGQYDLPGDILAWRNYLLNERAQIQHGISILKNKCGSGSSTTEYSFR
jgi:hypothetical protein